MPKRFSVNSNYTGNVCSKASCITGTSCARKKANFNVQTPLANVGCIGDAIVDAFGDTFPELEDVGAGSSLVVTGTAPTYELRGILGSTGVGVSSNSTDVIVSNTSTVADIGAGESIVSSGTPPTYNLKGIVSGGGGVMVTSNSTDVIITGQIETFSYTPAYTVNSIGGDTPIITSPFDAKYSRVSTNVVLHGRFSVISMVNAGSRTITFAAPYPPVGGFLSNNAAHGVCVIQLPISNDVRIAVVSSVVSTNNLSLTFTTPPETSFTGYYSIQYTTNNA